MKWEYTYSDGDNLNALGADGWEAVGIVKYEDGVEVLMKRPLVEESVEMTLTEFVEYGVYTIPLHRDSISDEGWIKDSTGRVITGSLAAMTAQAECLDASWGAEVRALPGTD